MLRLTAACTERPATMHETLRRHRLAVRGSEMFSSSVNVMDVPPLGDRAQIFADACRICWKRPDADCVNLILVPLLPLLSPDFSRRLLLARVGPALWHPLETN